MLPGMFRSCLVAVVAGLAAFDAVPALAVPDAAQVSAALNPIRAKNDLPALAGAIVTADGTFVAGATGLRKRGVMTPATAQDRWHIGSNTKAMTATLAARFVERGRLRWESTLGERFPELAGAMQPAARGITLLQLVSNRSGLPVNPDWWQIHNSVAGVRDQRLRALAFAGSAPLAFAPGTGFLYSNLGFAVAGAMIEREARDSWEELMKLHVFAPLGMKGCGFGGVGTPGQVDQPWGHLADGRAVDRNGPAVDNAPALGPAGTVHCTLESWAAFVADHLRGSRGEKALLSPDSYKRLHAPPAGDYALGWGTAQRDWAGGPVLTHNGSNTMNYSVAWLAPKRGFAVLVVANQAGPRAERGADEAASALIQLQAKR